MVKIFCSSKQICCSVRKQLGHFMSLYRRTVKEISPDAEFHNIILVLHQPRFVFSCLAGTVCVQSLRTELLSKDVRCWIKEYSLRSQINSGDEDKRHLVVLVRTAHSSSLLLFKQTHTPSFHSLLHFLLLQIYSVK